MFSKKHRLAKTKEVKLVIARGRGFFNQYFSVKCLDSKLSVPRFTVVISTKVYKQAVKRNRLKRIIREFFKLSIGQIKSLDYTVMVKPKAAAVEEKELMASLQALLESAKIYAKV